MKGSHIYSIEIENFRSINRKTEIRLDAPVVLLHGHNGAGKTSVLAAIELALTSAIPSLARADRDYKTQLLSYGASRGHVSVELHEVDGVSGPIHVDLTREDAISKQRLDPRKASFFSERCYLAQSLLSQLLTIYQEADSAVGSPLSRFVHELLGLDRLESLEVGLNPGRDLRNARKLVSTYEDVERERDRLNQAISTAHQETERLQETNATAEVALQNALSVLSLPSDISATDLVALETTLTSTSEQALLIDLADRARRLIALRREFERATSSAATVERSALDSAYQKAQSELAAWRKRYQADINRLLADIRQLFPNTNLPEDDPAHAIVSATTLIRDEVARLSAIAAREKAEAKRRIEVDDALQAASSRIAVLDKEISSIAVTTGSLSAALSELLPHIHTDDCPVCGRNFREVSKLSLSARAAARVRDLSDHAERLNALTRERSGLESHRAELEREKQSLTARAIAPKANQELQDRQAKLQNGNVSLKRLTEAATAGSALIAAEQSARRALSQFAARGQEEQALRASIDQQREALRLSPGDPAERLDGLLGRLEEHLRAEEARTKARLEARNTAIRELRSLRAGRDKIALVRSAIEEDEKRKRHVTGAFDAAEKIRSDARRVIGAVASTRASIVGSVFNNQLNRLWRDLFVRLAPGEDFVPAFCIPTDSTTRIIPALETRHRSGEIGGTPAAMLSSGNLNTAALTLFLALHLSVKAQLPWLILDDPVQSMDEVHISQFAALLRTLAKEHHRQLIIAVHDRALYEYLTLELSPAFLGDELITVEISTSAEDQTRAVTNRRAFEPDTTLKPIAA